MRWKWKVLASSPSPQTDRNAQERHDQTALQRGFPQRFSLAASRPRAEGGERGASEKVQEKGAAAAAAAAAAITKH